MGNCNKDIRGCIGCHKCKSTGRCVFDKDMVNELAPKLEQADGLVVGSPVYFAGPNGTLTNLMDRLFFSTPFSKCMKAGAAVVSARRAGTTAALDRLNKYFQLAEMPVVSSRYWNMVHGNTLAFLVRAIAAERERGGLPEAEPVRVSTNFIR